MTSHLGYAIGIDLGTSSCKTIIIDQNGKPLSFGSANYVFPGKNFSWIEQPPDILYRAVIKSLKSAINNFPTNRSMNECIGMSIGGALHSVLSLDQNDKPISNVITWADSRSFQQTELLAAITNPHDHYMNSGCPNHPMYPISKIKWMQQNTPDQFNNSARFISAKEYITWKLCGEFIVDYATASGSGLLNIHTLDWEKNSLSFAGIKKNQLSVLASPAERIGVLRSDIAKQVGLPKNIPISLGSADAVNSSLGAASVTPEKLTCMIGSSGAIRTITKKPLLDQEERLWCYAIDPDNWLTGGAINNGGLAISWLCETLSHIVQSRRQISFEQIMNWAEQAPPGSDGVICLPFFVKERSPYWNPNMRAIFFGLTLQHNHTHLARSIIEGIGFRLLSVLNAVQDLSGKERFEICTSGGFTKSSFWVQVLSDIFNQPMKIPSIGETSAVGAAFWVLISEGIVPKISDLVTLVQIDKTYYPNQMNYEIYKQNYRNYSEIYFSTRKIYDNIYR